MKPIVKRGDKVRFYLPGGVHFGTVDNAEIRYGSTYASITPDDEDNQVYLFYGAVCGFEPISELLHSWSPLAMARMKYLIR